LDGGFDLSSAQQERLLTIGGCNHCIAAQINADNRPTRGDALGDFTDDFDTPIVESDFHNPSWQQDGSWPADMQNAADAQRIVEAMRRFLSPPPSGGDKVI
jgi:hypothetical protein